MISQEQNTGDSGTIAGVGIYPPLCWEAGGGDPGAQGWGPLRNTVFGVSASGSQNPSGEGLGMDLRTDRLRPMPFCCTM